MPRACKSRGLTPNTSSTSPNVSPAIAASPLFSSFLVTGDGKKSRIPRPPNAFMLFRSSRAQEIKEQRRITGVTQRQANVSQMLGKEWTDLPQEKKWEWQEKAKKERDLHAQKFPGYQYRLLRKPKGIAERKAKKPPSSKGSHFVPQVQSNPPHLDWVPPYGADSNHQDHVLPSGPEVNQDDLTLHSSTWGCPPADHLLLPFMNTALEFMDLDLLAGTTFEEFYPLY